MMDNSLQNNIDALRNFRTRSAAKQRLIAAGDAAVEPLIEALDDPYEGLRWAAVSILAELRDDRAIDPLINALRDTDIVGHAADALKAITGHDYGEDADIWQRWRNGEAIDTGRPSERIRSDLTDAELIRQGLAGVADEVTESGDVYIAKVGLKDGRYQTVRINPVFRDTEGNTVVQIETVCGPAAVKHHDWALRQNLKLPFGAIAVRDISKQPHYVLVNTLLRETADPPEINTSVATLARWGDAIEKSLLKEDIS